MMAEAAVLGAAGSAMGLMAWGVRGRSAQLFAPSRWRGPSDRKRIAITFDDGPSESTPALLEILAKQNARCTFFQCGANAQRLPAVSREVLSAGHEIGNHSFTHAPLYWRAPQFVADELFLAQEAIRAAAGVTPAWFRAPFGCRWFGLREAQRRLSLTGVMWSAIGLDWKLDAPAVVERLRRGARNGAIFCLHDGRQLTVKPDVGATVEAVGRLLPLLRQQGYEMVTVSELLCSQTSSPA